MSFPRYPSYKDSGVEWLGQVPAHWEVKRLKHNLRLLTEKTSRRDHPVALENIEGWTGRFIATETEFEGEGVAFEKGDILFGKLRPYLAKAYRAESPGEAVGDFHVLRPRPGIDSHFARYQILSREFIAIVDGSTFGSKMPRASWDFVGGMKVTTPPIAEQTPIAEFLDRETGKIDELVAEQRRLMELLKEKRQAVISHAVTRGLNPAAPLKPSGIEWLGDVPAHWKVMALKRLIAAGTSISYGIVQPGEPLDDGVPFVQTTNMTTGNFDPDNLQRTTGAIADLYPRSQLTGGEVILGIRASIGAAHVVPDTLSGANLSRGVARIVPNLQITSRYLVSYFGTESVSRYWQLSKQGSTFNEVSIETVRELSVCIPPLPEQAQISEYVAIELSRFDTLTAEAQRAIDLLQERRTALISAAVTGQIDVRQLAEKKAA